MINLPDEAKLKKIWYLGKKLRQLCRFRRFLSVRFSSTLAKIRDPFFARSNNKLVCYDI